MKKLLLLFVILAVGCSKGDSIEEQISSGNHPIVGEWLVHSYLHIEEGLELATDIIRIEFTKNGNYVYFDADGTRIGVYVVSGDYVTINTENDELNETVRFGISGGYLSFFNEDVTVRLTRL